MDHRPDDRAPYARRVWPPDSQGDDVLPPSARWYGTPADPGRRRPPRWVGRFLAVGAALVVGVALIAGAVVLVLRVVNPGPAATTVTDALAGVRYTLPPGWREGAMAPVTAFTSVASDGGQAMVMVRPGPALGGRTARDEALRLADLYARLLLHGDTVDVVSDGAVTVGAAQGHGRALRAEYEDVVNRPAYLRIVVLDGGGRSVVLLGLAQPDEAGTRARIEAVIGGVRT